MIIIPIKKVNIWLPLVPTSATMLSNHSAWCGKASYHQLGSEIHQTGYNDVGGEIQFGQIERNPWLIQQFTGDNEGNVIMRIDNWNQLPGAVTAIEVSIDQVRYTVLNWVIGVNPGY